METHNDIQTTKPDQRNASALRELKLWSRLTTVNNKQTLDTDLRNVDPRPEQFQMFSHLLRFVLGVEDCQLSEDAHVSTLQS